jgi:hypothetical protein
MTVLTKRPTSGNASRASSRSTTPARSTPTSPVCFSTLIRPFPRRCTHTYMRVMPATGEIVRCTCDRWSCSVECQKRWSRRMGNALANELQQRPAQYEIRLTCHPHISQGAASAAHSRFFKALRRKEPCEYFAINEWKSGRRHLHAVVRLATPITLRQFRRLIRQLWSQSFPYQPSPHCASIRSQGAFSWYMCKLAEFPPPSFVGRLFSSSRGFLRKPPRSPRRSTSGASTGSPA